MGNHKTAISLTLDRDLCDWFSGGGKNRSLEINSVLRTHLREKLAGNEPREPTTPKQAITIVRTYCYNTYGADSPMSQVADLLNGWVKE